MADGPVFFEELDGSPTGGNAADDGGAPLAWPLDSVVGWLSVLGCADRSQGAFSGPPGTLAHSGRHWAGAKAAPPSSDVVGVSVAAKSPVRGGSARVAGADLCGWALSDLADPVSDLVGEVSAWVGASRGAFGDSFVVLNKIERDDAVVEGSPFSPAELGSAAAPRSGLAVAASGARESAAAMFDDSPTGAEEVAGSLPDSPAASGSLFPSGLGLADGDATPCSCLSCLPWSEPDGVDPVCGMFQAICGASAGFVDPAGGMANPVGASVPEMPAASRPAEELLEDIRGELDVSRDGSASGLDLAAQPANHRQLPRNTQTNVAPRAKSFRMKPLSHHDVRLDKPREISRIPRLSPDQFAQNTRGNETRFHPKGWALTPKWAFRPFRGSNFTGTNADV